MSRERDGMVSPELQLAAIRDHVAREGYDLVTVLEGLDESGSRARSAWWPRLDQAVGSVEAGEHDVIVVWKFSRAARQRLRWAVAIDRVEEAGGRLESATERVDVTTSTGRFTRGMLGELNAFEAERIGEGWREAHARRVAGGRPASGKPKFGYVYDSVEKVHRPDPETGPLLAGLYSRYVAGESAYALVRWLNDRGWRTTADGVWSSHTLRRVLDSGFGAGLFRAGDQLRQGVHEPVIDTATWEAYLQARAGRRARPAGSERSAYVLSGLVRCGRCGGPMHAGQFGAGRVAKYRCSDGVTKGAAVCAGGYAAAHLVETAVLDWLPDAAAAVDEAADRVEVVTPSTAVPNRERLRRELKAADQAYSRLVLQHAQAPLPAAVYADARAELQGRHDCLEALLVADLANDASGTVADPVRRPLLEAWPTIPVMVRREVLRQLVSAVVVKSGRPRATVTVIPIWHGRDGTGVTGNHHPSTTPTSG